jgi:hypothetical protein
MRLKAVAAVLLVFGASGVGAQPAGVPADFRLRLESAGRIPGSRVEWIEIEASGRTRMSAMDARDGVLPEAALTLSPAAVARIWDRVRTERFFELQPLYRDPNVRDGDYAQISVTAGGRTHRVRTVNIRVHAFDRIAVITDRELPVARRIQYNALHVEAYKAVER